VFLLTDHHNHCHDRGHSVIIHKLQIQLLNSYCYCYQTV